MSAHTSKYPWSRGIASIYVFALMAIVIIAVFSALYLLLDRFAITYSNAVSKISVLSSRGQNIRVVDVTAVREGLNVIVEFSGARPIIGGPIPCIIESLDGSEKSVMSCDASIRGNRLIIHVPSNAIMTYGRYIEVIIPSTYGLTAFRLYHGPTRLDVSLPPYICYNTWHVASIAVYNNSTGWCKVRVYLEFYYAGRPIGRTYETLIIPPSTTRYVSVNFIVRGVLPAYMSICVREVVNDALEYPPICYALFATLCY